jgi:hypothetical protein
MDKSLSIGDPLAGRPTTGSVCMYSKILGAIVLFSSLPLAACSAETTSEERGSSKSNLQDNLDQCSYAFEQEDRCFSEGGSDCVERCQELCRGGDYGHC